MIHVGTIAFEASVEDAEVALSRREGLQDVHFVRSGQCEQFPALPSYLVEVHDEHDGLQAKWWMDRVEQALAGHVGSMHRCVG
jgi:hypothetical protein